MIQVTTENMRRLVEVVDELSGVSDAARDWLEAKDDGTDRESIRDARDQLDASLEDASSVLADLCCLIGRSGR